MSEEFLKLTEELVSNESIKREAALEKAKQYLQTIPKDSTGGDLMSKLWKSIFYSFWNTDKRNYQLQISKQIAGFITSSSILINTSQMWIESFINEFSIKFSSVDYLRLDKYIMLADQIISTYLFECLNNKSFKQINAYVSYLIERIQNKSSYNFTFQSVHLKLIARFVEYVLTNANNHNEFVAKHLKEFIRLVFAYFTDAKEKREIKVFEDHIVLTLVKTLKEHAQLQSEVKSMVLQIIENNKESLIHVKLKCLEFFVKKLEDDSYEKETNAMNVIDPVNDYILKKNYTAKFKKSASDKKKEVIQKEKELKKKKKEMVVKENNASLTISSEPSQKENEDNIITEEIISLTNDKADAVQPDTKHSIANHSENKDNDENDNDNDEEQLLEENDDDDDDEGNEEDDELNEIANEESDEDDYDYEYGIIPEEFEVSEEEEVTPENIQIQKALKNSQRNQKVGNQSYKQFLGKKKQNSFNEDKDNKNANKLKKRKIKYVLEHNVTHVYDRKKPIMLTSNKKNVIPTDGVGLPLWRAPRPEASRARRSSAR